MTRKTGKAAKEQRPSRASVRPVEKSLPYSEVIPEDLDPLESSKRDWMLGEIVGLSNTTDAAFDLILYLPTGVVAGTTISGKTYFERMANSFGDPTSASPENSVARMIHEMGEGYEPDGEDGGFSEDHPFNTRIPQFVHLEDCRIYFPGASPFPTNEGVLWRGNLDKVVGFTFGSVTAKERKSDDRVSRSKS